MKSQSPILPGATIGVLGSGQLGRMFAIAARQMGYRIHTFSPEKDTPTGQVADKEWVASYNDHRMLTKFANAVDVMTFEFENIPFESVNVVSKKIPVFPRAEVLHITQNRLREKNFLFQNGFAVSPFAHVVSSGDLNTAIKKVGVPAVLKTAGFGYDGKGQKKVYSLKEAEMAYKTFKGAEAVLEGFVDFEKEISVVGARAWDGTFAAFGVMENVHRNHILDVTISPARISPKVAKSAVSLAERIFRALDVVGVMCVEMFLKKNGQLIVNELAPRPHNSGHLTIDAFVTSQFEQQVRAVCGLSLGSVHQLQPAAMVNLLGDVWKNGQPKWDRALKNPNVKIHLYGKGEPRPGRKMGHITALGKTVDTAHLSALKARVAL